MLHWDRRLLKAKALVLTNPKPDRTKKPSRLFQFLIGRFSSNFKRRIEARLKWKPKKLALKIKRLLLPHNFAGLREAEFFWDVKFQHLLQKLRTSLLLLGILQWVGKCDQAFCQCKAESNQAGVGDQPKSRSFKCVHIFSVTLRSIETVWRFGWKLFALKLGKWQFRKIIIWRNNYLATAVS